MNCIMLGLVHSSRVDSIILFIETSSPNNSSGLLQNLIESKYLDTSFVI